MHDEPLRCLECGVPFDAEDVNATYTSRRDRTLVLCTHCGARNEIRAQRMPGLAEPPRAVVVRLAHD